MARLNDLPASTESVEARKSNLTVEFVEKSLYANIFDCSCYSQTTFRAAKSRDCSSKFHPVASHPEPGIDRKSVV